MVKRPTGPFWDASHHTDKAKDRANNRDGSNGPNNLRDKDNADKRMPPPRLTPFGERNRAPKGMSGIKRNLPNPDQSKAEAKSQFKEPGALKREFKPIARNDSKNRDIER
jgi:hypothetical protein